jgi:hypothetical protein
MAGRTSRVRAAQTALEAAIMEMIEASDEMDLADAIRLGNVEEAEESQKLQGSITTHWAVAASRTFWERDQEDLEDSMAYPNTRVSVLVQDDTSPPWMLGGLLRYAAEVVEE